MLLPFSLITALHDRFMFSSKPPTLGFTGSVIKSWGETQFLFYYTKDRNLRVASDRTIHCRARGQPWPPVSDRINSRTI